MFSWYIFTVFKAILQHLKYGNAMPQFVPQTDSVTPTMPFVLDVLDDSCRQL